jgi:PAS domain S-box-containing protein
MKKRGSRLTHDQRILWLAFAWSTPALAIALWLLWTRTSDDKAQWTVTILLAGAWLGGAFAIRERVIRPLQTASNLLAALREEDFSIRARGARPDDPLGELMIEVNALRETLREQRFGALEATALLRTVMEEIDVAIFTFDAQERLQLTNRAGERLLAQPAERLLGRTAPELGLSECLQGETSRTFQRTFPGAVGRWSLRRSSFRRGGVPHHLIVLADLSKALREEERQAWQRLLRVLGHELNNSLAPIKSIGGSLSELVRKDPPPDDWKEDMQRGLNVIATRAEALSRFIEGYSKLARLPQPRLEAVSVETLVNRVVSLETRIKVEVAPSVPAKVEADPDQLEQLLINLVRNAVDAVLHFRGALTEPAVRLGWTRNPSHLAIWVEDDGPGISNPANLFVPFFTTKPGGSGIGLVLCRQIAEAHGGSLTLETRKSTGCVATLRLPLVRAK